MTEKDKQWIIDHAEAGELEDGTPWVAIPNKPDREWTIEEILETFNANAEK